MAKSRRNEKEAVPVSSSDDIRDTDSILYRSE